jgi:outer membrane protein insertion porin family
VSNNASLAVKQAEADSPFNVSSIGYTVAYDTRNLPQSPSSGVFTSFSQDFAGIGGDVSFLRSVADARGYYPITNKITFVSRVQGGVINGFGEDLRMTDLFFKGGETIRGFERAGIGPRDACRYNSDFDFLDPPATVTAGERIPNCRRDSLGGEMFWATTAEVRFPFPLVPDNLGMQGAVFVDVGSLWQPTDSVERAVGLPPAGTLLPGTPCNIGKNCGEGSFIDDSAEIRMSVGFSIIWQSPLGPLRADIAQALLKADFDKTELFRFGASTNF